MTNLHVFFYMCKLVWLIIIYLFVFIDKKSYFCEMENGKNLFYKSKSRLTPLERIFDSEYPMDNAEDALMEWITMYQTRSLTAKEKRQFEKALMGNMELMRYVQEKALLFEHTDDSKPIYSLHDLLFWFCLLGVLLVVVVGYFYLG